MTKKKVTKTARAKWGAEEGEEEEAEVEEEDDDADDAGDFDSDDDDVRERREVKEEVDNSPPATLIDYQKVNTNSTSTSATSSFPTKYELTCPALSPSPDIVFIHFYLSCKPTSLTHDKIYCTDSIAKGNA